MDGQGIRLTSRMLSCTQTYLKNTRIWMRLPNNNSITSANGGIFQLQKSLYGLREPPKFWYATIEKLLKSLELEALSCSECLFVLRRGGLMVIILAYVDDLGLFGDFIRISWVKDQLSKRLRITDLGPSKYFLGVSISEEESGISLTQKPLLERILVDTGMTTCKATRSPPPLSHILYESRKDLTEAEMHEMEGNPYKKVLGSLLYLRTRTRPDFSTAASMLANFSSSPSAQHWTAMKHVLRYLQGTEDYGLHFPKSGTILAGQSDADWGRDRNRRRSRSGVLLTIGGNPVSRSSNLQTIVALSTCEAEFLALSECVRELKWLRQVLCELSIDHAKTTVLFQGNLGTMK